MAPRLNWNSSGRLTSPEAAKYVTDRASLRSRGNVPRTVYAKSATTYNKPDPGGDDGWYTLKEFPFSSEGTVQIVRGKQSHQLFVVKTLPWAGGVTHAEVQAIKHLSCGFGHRNLVQVFNNFTADNGDALIVQEFCDGGDLRETLNHWQRTLFAPVPTVVVAHAFAQIASGLAFLHNGIHHCSGSTFNIVSKHEPMIHGDIKAENILLRWSKQSIVSGLPDFVIADFGHSRPVSQTDRYYGTSTLTPPEVELIRGEVALQQEHTRQFLAGQGPDIRLPPPDPLTPAVDVFTFGLIMAEMLTGEYTTGDVDPDDLVMPHHHELPAAWYYTHRCLESEPELRLPLFDTPPKQGLEITRQSTRCLLSAIVTFTNARDAILARNGKPRDQWWPRPLGSQDRSLGWKLPVHMIHNIPAPRIASDRDDDSGWVLVNGNDWNGLGFNTELY